MVNEKSAADRDTPWWKCFGFLNCGKIFTRRRRARNSQNTREQVESMEKKSNSVTASENNNSVTELTRMDLEKQVNGITTSESKDIETELLKMNLEKRISSITTRLSRIKYGELVRLGYNGGKIDRKGSRYVLFQRYEPNGAKISKQYVARSSTTQTATDQQNAPKYSISYVLSPKKSVVVEYIDDTETDMFQIGRSNQWVIDFHVSNSKEMQFVSRYGCRILVERTDASAKLFAAGFDSNRNIFLGERAMKWEEDGEMDGVTTNGVLIMHPKGSFTSGEAESGEWRECSVGGSVLNLRKSRFKQERTEKIQDEKNVLQDGTLIDLCGVTLIWRSAEGLKNSLTNRDIEKSAVGLNSLLMPREVTSGETITKPYFFLKCEHVQLYREREEDKSSDDRLCIMCYVKGPVVPLSMGLEPAFSVDSGPPTHAFNPCGHMTSERTVKYWANVSIPKEIARKGEINGFEAVCPFCRTVLASPGYVKLKF